MVKRVRQEDMAGALELEGIGKDDPQLQRWLEEHRGRNGGKLRIDLGGRGVRIIFNREGRCCIDRRVGRRQPQPHPHSFDPDGDRASELQHAVQDIDGDGNLGGTTPVLVKAQPVAEHLFVSSNGGFDPAPLGVS
jgi:hypothetical protein